MIVDLVAGMFERLSLDGAVPRAALPIIFLAAVVNPGRKSHLEAATQAVQIRFVDLAKLRQLFGSIGIVIDGHAAKCQLCLDALSIFQTEPIGIGRTVLRIDHLRQINSRVARHGEGELGLVGVDAIDAGHHERSYVEHYSE